MNKVFLVLTFDRSMKEICTASNLASYLMFPIVQARVTTCTKSAMGADFNYL